MEEEKSQDDERTAEILKNDGGFVKNNFYIFGDLWNFMRVRKKWWLLPIFITLVLVGSLILFGQASPLSPFIYALI
jgi:hypothetical protein